ncbi:tyrosine-type recombinase/integrase [Peribacillus asahii]|uniref:tyrosine-type recombinase/integrase n=1 Tax=Peribacillus asahii TaxID=228899 RepID=UPI0037F6E9AB
MLDKFIQELERTGKSQNTINAYTTDVKQFQKWLDETLGHETNDITQTDVREYKSYLLNVKKLSVASINRKLKSVVLFQNFLHTTGEMKAVVNIKEVLQKNTIESDHDVKIVEKQDLYKLKRTIEATGNKRDICIYYLLFGTAIRVSELTGLTLDDIHLTERNGANNYSYIIVRGKGDKIRKIELNADVVKAIKSYIEVRPITTDNKLLQGQRGAMTRLGVNKLLEKYSKQAQIETVTPHMARHTALTMMIKNGVDVKTVANIAGHSSTDVTFKFYVSSNAEDRQNAVDNLDI